MTVKEKANLKKWESIKTFITMYFRGVESFNNSKYLGLDKVLVEKYKITKSEAAEFRDKWFAESELKTAYTMNHTTFMEAAKKYEANLIAKNVPLDDDLLVKLIDWVEESAKAIKENTDPELLKSKLLINYRRSFIMQYIGEKID